MHDRLKLCYDRSLFFVCVAMEIKNPFSEICVLPSTEWNNMESQRCDVKWSLILTAEFAVILNAH